MAHLHVETVQICLILLSLQVAEALLQPAPRSLPQLLPRSLPPLPPHAELPPNTSPSNFNSGALGGILAMLPAHGDPQDQFMKIATMLASADPKKAPQAPGGLLPPLGIATPVQEFAQLLSVVPSELPLSLPPGFVLPAALQPSSAEPHAGPHHHHHHHRTAPRDPDQPSPFQRIPAAQMQDDPLAATWTDDGMQSNGMVGGMQLESTAMPFELDATEHRRVSQHLSLPQQELQTMVEETAIDTASEDEPALERQTLGEE